MTLTDLITATGKKRSEIARLLGYASENSLRQMLAGDQKLPEADREWLVRYAEMRKLVMKFERDWLEANPPPARKRKQSAHAPEKLSR